MNPTPVRDLFADISDEGEAAIAAWNTVLEDFPPVLLWRLTPENLNVYLCIDGGLECAWELEARRIRRVC